MASASYQPSCMNVLVVDDHPPIRKAICKVLRSLGIEQITECPNALSACIAFNKLNFDLVVLDLYLGDQSGHTVLADLRSRDNNNDTPVLIVTGEADRDEIVRSVDQGANDYMVKPFHADELSKKIDLLLTNHHSPDQITRLNRSAERLLFEKRPDEALQFIEQALTLDPQNLRATHCHGLFWFAKDEPEKAIETFNRNISLNPQNYRSHRAKADVLVSINRNDEAIETLRAELQINPKIPSRQLLLGKTLYQQNQVDEAMKHLRAALVEDAKSSEALLYMGMSFAQQENIDKAIYYIKRIRRYHPFETKPLDLAIQLALKFEQFKKFEMLLRDDRNINPNQAEIHVALAKFYHKTENPEKLAEIIEVLKTKFSDNDEASLLIADVAYEQKDYETAGKFYSKLLKQQKTPQFCIRLTRCLIEVKDFARAELMALNLYRLRRPVEAMKLLGELYLKSNEVTKAALIYKRLIVLSQQSPNIKVPPAAQKALDLVHARRQKTPRVA